VDLEEAYNLVPRKLWPAIRDIGIPQKILVVIRKMYAKNEAQVKTGKRISTGLRIVKGMKRGCGLPPDLFKIFLESELYNWNKRCKSMGLLTANKTTHHHLFFVDNQVIIAQDKYDTEYKTKILT
jgi:hypothetical protein